MKKKKTKSSSKNIKKIVIPAIIGTALIGLSVIYIVKNKDDSVTESSKLFSGSIYTANFSANLLDNLDSKTNIVISPTNINTTLAIFYNAADNNTKKELKNYFKAEVDNVNEQYSSLTTTATKTTDNEYLSLYKEYISEFIAADYPNLTINKLNKLSSSAKYDLLLLIRKIEISYESSSETTNYTIKLIRNYELTDDEKKMSSYKIKNKIDVINDTWESLNIQTKNINQNYIYYNNLNINNSFIKKVTSFYNIKFSAIDLTDSTTSRKNIIKEFKDLTDEQIKNFIDEKELTNSSLISLNISYFNSEWENNFSKDNVKSTEFTNLDSTISAVDMMYEEQTSYLENDYAYGFVKDFKDQKYSFIGVLPKKTGDFQASSLDLNTLLESEKFNNVEIGIPKFSYQSVIDTSSIIENASIKELTSSQPNITKMTDDKTAINVFKQVALITIAEKGTVSSSYSLSDTSYTSEEYEKKIYLNRPFLFLIRDNSNNEIIMIGKVTNL